MTELLRLRAALQQIRSAGENYDSTAIWMQMVAAHALLPDTFPEPSESPPTHLTVIEPLSHYDALLRDLDGQSELMAMAAAAIRSLRATGELKSTAASAESLQSETRLSERQSEILRRMIADEELSDEEFKARAHRIALEAHEDRLQLWESLHTDPLTGARLSVKASEPQGRPVRPHRSGGQPIPPQFQEDRLYRIDKLMDAQFGTPEGAELDKLVDEQVEAEKGLLR